MSETAAADDEQSLWQRWLDGADATAREELLVRYTAYARVVAATFYARRFHDAVEFDDYVQFAQVGMLESFERFDPSHGVLFKSFASRRIQGAILDGIEHMTERQQQVAAHKRLRAERRESIIDPESAARIATRAPEQVLQFVADVGIGLALAWMLEGSGMIEENDPSATLPFYRNAELQQLRDRLLRVVKALPPPQAKVISWHYLQEIPFDQIAGSMGLTKGRISQIHKQALLALRAELGSRPACDVDW